ncbi:MAG TPA: nucleotidyltransferase family protein [Bryobacteraceae bacterium]|nr:nucleotidyltransferase family protein [Bryobacteraceae bacterium]
MNGLPPYVGAVLAALRFRSPQPQALATLDEAGWRQALLFCDRSQLTLPLALTSREYLPQWVATRIDRDLEKSAERWQRVKNAYAEAATAFESAGLECAVLKGFSHYPRFVGHPHHRYQGDLDLLFTPAQVHEAYQAARDLGYVPIAADDSHPTNHLPTLIRKTGWIWTGDYFDPEIPIALELHFGVWDERTELFAPAGIEEFWNRRRQRRIDDLCFTGFHPADETAIACLHVMCHLLRGSLRPSHVYEMAWMLDRSTADEAFWETWRELHDPFLRRLEATCFALSERWFRCGMPAAALDEIERLAAELKRWLDLYSWSPLSSPFRPNKDELWLHWSLLDCGRSRMRVLARRLLPRGLPGAVDTVTVPREQLTWSVRWRARCRYMGYLASRVLHHARALLPTVRSAIRWFGSTA